MTTMSRSVTIPHPRRGRRELAEDTRVRLGLHVKAAEQAMMAAKTEALRSFGITVAQYTAMLSLYYVPEQSSAQLARAAAVTTQTMATVISRLEQKNLVIRHPSSDHAKVLIASLTPAGEAMVLRADEVARSIEQRMAEAFSAEERQQLTEMLERLTAVLRGDLDAE
ncbi:MarR family transcriptional regulator [Actinomyces viscosus]|uniref:Transcriptional regulator SlyA n=1 Tax=Actinomyces viscosus TaxID=1656 RepID=A0A3S4XAQ9_ACTVI|nr:MarR family transcriptional regulator [Actinomyces viscosus]TFH52091.1 MarR family transcriptional regulator [Actinomyces viscosus]VEI17607.1 transcriptional regulator SlyA [Actinomyces viscosus]